MVISQLSLFYLQKVTEKLHIQNIKRVYIDKVTLRRRIFMNNNNNENNTLEISSDNKNKQTLIVSTIILTFLFMIISIYNLFNKKINIEVNGNISEVSTFTNTIAKAIKEKNIPFTIHAGENGSHKEIDLAIKIGTKRIGHGIHAYENEDTIKLLKEKNILIICHYFQFF